MTDHQLDIEPGPLHPDAPASALDAWLQDLAVELGVGPDVLDVSAVLDAAAAAAGCVGRPAGSLTTFLVGYAAAQGPAEGRPAALRDALERTTMLAEQWQDRLARLDGRV
ncbi:hypothetical protein DDP54_03130 [Cellulomonas sp. WB94]|uniref:DUF6457 domain-containing protein n=1 Tax=Cellulomonas sp. WB94 TaxID=2173174 RepID=UPI000D56CD88|nr:DUF6457 domain-containing protein [Cellulomonas sp. WB94]PVU82167.1 hypothetical protein DDP54_03130 [Cellulomonas sp. WB94]